MAILFLDPLNLEAFEKLSQIVQRRAPEEAVGLVLLGGGGPQVVELPNRSSTPLDRFETSVEDLPLDLLQEWSARCEGQGQLVLWHSHPSGGVGPSDIDMKNRRPDARHLVLTITADRDIVPTWY